MSDTDSFIREVTEEVRQDRLYRFWKRYGAYVIGAVAAILAGAAAWNWQAAEARRDAMSRAAAFLSAGPTAEDKAAVIGAVDGPAAALARLDYAAALIAKGDREGGLAAYRDIAESEGLSLAYADLARLHAARLEAPRLPLSDAEAMIFPLTAEGAPYRLLALELRAALRLTGGDREGALEDLTAILTAPGLTGDLNRRTQQMLAVMGPDLAAAGATGGPQAGSEAETEPGTAPETAPRTGPEDGG